MVATSSPLEPGRAFVERSVASGGFQIRYWEAGHGVPLVYLPGAGGPRPSIALDVLAADFRVLVFELPGWGDEPNDVADFDGLANQVAAAVAAVGLDLYHLMGTSLGGACALHLATLYPDRVRSLVLEAPAELREQSTPPDQMSPEQLVAAFRRHPERIPHMSPPEPAFMERVWPTVVRLMGGGGFDEAFGARLAALPTRTLIVFGRDDGIINPVNGRTYRRLLRNSTLQYVYDAGHDIQADRPEAFAALVGDFLARGMAFMINGDVGILNP